MDLNNILNRKLRSLSSRRKKPAKRQPIAPEKKHKENLKYILKKLELGDYEPKKKSHAILMSIAIKEGYVDKNTLEIIKEVV